MLLQSYQKERNIVIQPKINVSFLAQSKFTQSIKATPFTTFSRSSPSRERYLQKKLKILESDFIGYGVEYFPTYWESSNDLARNEILISYYRRYFDMKTVAKRLNIRINQNKLNRKFNSEFQKARQGAAANP